MKMKKRKTDQPIVNWRARPNGTLHAKVGNLVPTIREQEDGTFGFTMKVDYAFDDKGEAEYYADQVIASLQENDLSSPEEWVEEEVIA